MPSKSFNRTDRISAQLRKEISVMVHAAVRDHALPSVSVSDVEVTKDLDFATVYVTTLLADDAKVATKALNELAKEFRRELSRMLKIRRVPELRFRYDDSVDKGERIESLLRDDRNAEDNADRGAEDNEDRGAEHNGDRGAEDNEDRSAEK